MIDRNRQAQEHYEQGNQFDEAGDAVRAMDEWKLATQLNPNYFDAHYNLGIAYADADDLNAAIAEMEIACGLEPEDKDARRELAQMLIERGDAFIAQKDAGRATQDWERALELDSENALAHFKLGEAYADSKKFSDAENELREAIRCNRFFTDAYDQLAEIYLADNRTRDAMDVLRSALNTFRLTSTRSNPRLVDPPHIETMPLDTSVSDLARDLAELELDQGDPDQAMAALEQAEPVEDDAELWNGIAKAFDAQGDQESADIARNRAADILRGDVGEDDSGESEPTDERERAALAEQHFDAGEAHYERGEVEKAFEEYSQAVELNPDHADAHYSLGLIYEDDAEYDLAAKEFRAALRVDPNDEEVREHLGQVTRAAPSAGGSKPGGAFTLKPRSDDPNAQLAQQRFDEGERLYARGNFDQAREEYQRAVRLDPDHGDAHYSLGLIYAREKNYAEAEKEFRESLRIDPHSADAHFGLGGVFDALEDWQSALSEYRAALECDPEHSDAHESLIWDLLETNELLEAQKELKRAKLEADAAGDLWEEMGRMHEERGERGGAIAAYRRALELNAHLKDARGRLKQLEG